MLSFLILAVLLISTANSQLICPTNKTLQITSDNVLSHGIQYGIFDFINALSTSPDLGEGYFYSSYIPNEGYFILDDDYVLTGFTTQGEEISFTEYSVSKFSVEIVSNKSNYNNFTKIYFVNTFHEVYFPLDSLVPTHEIFFNALDKASTGAYYWKIGLFGCKAVDAYTVPVCDSPPSDTLVITTAVSTIPTQTTITTTLADSSSITSDERTTVTVYSTIYHTAVSISVSTSVRDRICSSFMVASPDPRSSLAAVSGSNTRGSNAGALAGAIVPLLLIIIVIVIILAVILIWTYRRKAWTIKPTAQRSRNNTLTLKEIKNVALYSTEQEIDDSTKVMITSNDSSADMINNELYGDSISYEEMSSDQQLPKPTAINSFPPSDDNVYSSIDHDQEAVYTDPDKPLFPPPPQGGPTANTVYEYMDRSHCTDENVDITSTPNPSYATTLPR